MQYIHYNHFSSQHGYPKLRIREWNVNSNLPLVFQRHFPHYQIIVDELVEIPELYCRYCAGLLTSVVGANFPY